MLLIPERLTTYCWIILGQCNLRSRFLLASGISIRNLPDVRQGWELTAMVSSSYVEIQATKYPAMDCIFDVKCRSGFLRASWKNSQKKGMESRQRCERRGEEKRRKLSYLLIVIGVEHSFRLMSVWKEEPRFGPAGFMSALFPRFPDFTDFQQRTTTTPIHFSNTWCIYYCYHISYLTRTSSRYWNKTADKSLSQVVVPLRQCLYLYYVLPPPHMQYSVYKPSSDEANGDKTIQWRWSSKGYLASKCGTFATSQIIYRKKYSDLTYLLNAISNADRCGLLWFHTMHFEYFTFCTQTLRRPSSTSANQPGPYTQRFTTT